MTDREKMINELTYQINSNEVMRQFYPVQISVSDARKILELLEKPKTKWIQIDPNSCGHSHEYQCESCGESIFLWHYAAECHYKYCPYCGREIDRDDT